MSGTSAAEEFAEKARGDCSGGAAKRERQRELRRHGWRTEVRRYHGKPEPTAARFDAPEPAATESTATPKAPR